MNSDILRKYQHGLHFNNEGHAEIVVWAPLAEKIELALQGSGKRLPLAKEELGYWKAGSSEIKPGDLYKIVIDGEKELPDAASLAQPEGIHGPSMAVDLKRARWSDENWRNHPLDDYILYELHTGTFTEEGTFAGLEQKLDYLKDLGVNAIEIMPVAQFAGDRNWGYDGAAPFAVQNSYGGAEALQHLVDVCHQKGIAVVLDVVYNHLGPEGNYLPDYGPYFTSKYNTPWGNAINFDDEYCYGVRQYFIQNALMWFRDFHIDALRLDAVHAIKDFSPAHILREIKLEVNKLMEQTGRKHYLIVELDLNDTRFINPLEEQGYGMDAQWIDEFHHALRISAGEEKTGYYSDFQGVADLAKSYRDAYVFDGQYSEHRKKFFGIKAENNPGHQFIVFSQNHDQVGNRMLGERLNELVSFEMKKVAAGAVLISPYLPMLFMGEEWIERRPFLYFVSHTDEQLAESVREGRKQEFADFHADGEAPDPVSEETFDESKVQWRLLNKEPHKTILNYYKTLISLRKQHPVLKRPDRKLSDVECQEDQQLIFLHRWSEDQHVYCLMNFSKQQQEVKLPDLKEEWKKLVYSAEARWKGNATLPETFASGQSISLAPESLLIID